MLVADFSGLLGLFQNHVGEQATSATSEVWLCLLHLTTLSG